MRILIAEDDPALASFVRKDLEAEHYAGCFSGRRAGARHSRELLEADDAGDSRQIVALEICLQEAVVDGCRWRRRPG